MKEKLKNSLVNLNNAIEELSQSISNHNTILNKQHSENLSKYREELSNSLSLANERETEIKRLNDTIIVQRDKIARTETKVKDLIVNLKNKIEQL